MIADIVSLNDYVVERTRSRLAGLTDDEMFWEPAPGCLTVRAGPGSTWVADSPVDAEVGPLTTIAWRLWHLTDAYSSPRNAEWLGAKGLRAVSSGPASNADTALMALDEAAGWWSALLAGQAENTLTEPLGPVAGPYAESTRLSFLLHLLDEQIHHGAEIGVMRDLYLALPSR